MKHKFDGIKRYRPFIKRRGYATLFSDSSFELYTKTQTIFRKVQYGTDEQRKILARHLWENRKNIVRN